MKYSLTLAALASFATAHPLLSTRASDTISEWGTALAGDKSACADLAVIFARGTFDPGNVGPWVGAPFYDALKAKHSSVSFQGVAPEGYPADLAGYLEEGGSNKCAASMGVVVDAYLDACPDAKIIISGWSQGALCARKSFGIMSEESASKVAAYVSFGDPYQVWADSIDFPEIPSNAQQIAFCGSAPTDALCGSFVENWPTTAKGVIDHLKEIWNEVDQAKMNAAQKSALASLVTELPSQALHQIDTLASDMIHGHLARWMLLPQHFLYGMDGSTDSAAAQVAALA